MGRYLFFLGRVIFGRSPPFKYRLKYRLRFCNKTSDVPNHQIRSSRPATTSRRLEAVSFVTTRRLEAVSFVTAPRVLPLVDVPPLLNEIVPPGGNVLPPIDDAATPVLRLMDDVDPGKEVTLDDLLAPGGGGVSSILRRKAAVSSRLSKMLRHRVAKSLLRFRLTTWQPTTQMSSRRTRLQPTMRRTWLRQTTLWRTTSWQSLKRLDLSLDLSLNLT